MKRLYDEFLQLEGMKDYFMVGIDSLGFYEILIEADTCFGIRIKEEELLRFRTVSDILDHLETLELRPPHAETA